MEGGLKKQKMTSFKQVGRSVGEEESEGRSQQEGSSRKVRKRFVRRVRKEKQDLKEKTKRAGNSALSILARTFVPRVCGISRSSPPGLVFGTPLGGRPRGALFALASSHRSRASLRRFWSASEPPLSGCARKATFRKALDKWRPQCRASRR